MTQAPELSDDLDRAITLISAEEHWSPEDWSCPYEPSDGHWAVATILNAILAGELVRSTPAPDDLRAAAVALLAMKEGVIADVKSAHANRGNGASDWMRDDDRDFRRALRAAFDLIDAALRDAQPATPAADDLRAAAKLILSQPKRAGSLTAEAFYIACAYLENDESGAETTNEIIETFLKHLAGED